jgi:hypothetical protein
MSVPTAISEMSSQIIPLKGRSDSWHHSEFRPQRLFACELRRGDTRLGPSVQDRGRGDVTLAEMAGIAPIFVVVPDVDTAR